MPLNGLYDVTISLYALSVLGYFIDFLDNNRKANRFAFWLLSIVWILQTIIFGIRMKELGEFPVLSTSDGLFFYAWIMVTLSLFINRLFRVDFLVFFANLIGFTLMSINLFKPSSISSSEALSKHLMTELLVIHITMAFLAYGAFTLSFIYSMMYLIEYRMLKKKQWGKRLTRFGSLDKIEQYAFYSNIVGVLFFLLGLVLGIVRAYSVIPNFSWGDPKVVLSFIVIMGYGIYLYQRVGHNVYGKPLIYWNTIAFLLLLINIFFSGIFTSFHFW